MIIKLVGIVIAMAISGMLDGYVQKNVQKKSSMNLATIEVLLIIVAGVLLITIPDLKISQLIITIIGVILGRIIGKKLIEYKIER